LESHKARIGDPGYHEIEGRWEMKERYRVHSMATNSSRPAEPVVEGTPPVISS
jgi:hypothetical protein